MRNSEDEMNDNKEAAKSLAIKAAFSASIAIIALMSQAMHWVESESKKSLIHFTFNIEKI